MKKLFFLVFFFASASSFSEPCLNCKLCASNRDGSCAQESSLCADPNAETGGGGFCHTKYNGKIPYCTCVVYTHTLTPDVIYEY